MVSEQQRVNLSFHEADLKRLDDWAGVRGISRSRAVVALLDLATGETETREQRMARERGLISSPSMTLPGVTLASSKPTITYEQTEEGYRYVDDSEDFKQ